MLSQLVDFEYYEDEDLFGGTSIPETSFNEVAKKASSMINYYTYKRINNSNLDNNVKNATCEIAEIIYSQTEIKKSILLNGNLEKKSETVGPHSVIYVDKTSIINKFILSDNELEKKCLKICTKYLGKSGLMYRGI